MDYLISSFDIGVGYWILIFGILFICVFITKNNSLSLLITYVAFIFISTVFHRNPKDSISIQIVPLWSYYEIIIHRDLYLFWECLFNIGMMIPIGYLLLNIKKNISILQVILIVFGISFGIEILQLITKTGLFEWDDMIHGCIGAGIGYKANIVIMRFYKTKVKKYESMY